MSCASCFSSFLQETDIMSFTFNIQAITQVHSVNRVLGRALPFWQQSLSQTLTPFMQPSLHCCQCSHVRSSQSPFTSPCTDYRSPSFHDCSTFPLLSQSYHLQHLMHFLTCVSIKLPYMQTIVHSPCSEITQIVADVAQDPTLPRTNQHPCPK